MTLSSDPEWLESLVFAQRPWFEACERCQVADAQSFARQPGLGPRMQGKATFYDIDTPQLHASALCATCATHTQATQGHRTLRIWRASHTFVVRVRDLRALGVPVWDVQPYTINGQRVVFLHQRPVYKTTRRLGQAPTQPRCRVDGRILLDASVQYCSLECRLRDAPVAATSSSDPSNLDTAEPQAVVVMDCEVPCTCHPAAATAPPPAMPAPVLMDDVTRALLMAMVPQRAHRRKGAQPRASSLE